MKTTTALKYFSIPVPSCADGHIQVAPGDMVQIGDELYPATAFASGLCVVVKKGAGIGLVDSTCVQLVIKDWMGNEIMQEKS